MDGSQAVRTRSDRVNDGDERTDDPRGSTEATEEVHEAVADDDELPLTQPHVFLAQDREERPRGRHVLSEALNGHLLRLNGEKQAGSEGTLRVGEHRDEGEEVRAAARMECSGGDDHLVDPRVEELPTFDPVTCGRHGLNGRDETHGPSVEQTGESALRPRLV